MRNINEGHSHMRYLGHIARWGGDNLEKVIIQGQIQGTHKRGRPNYAGLMASKKPQVFISMQPTDHPRIEIDGDLSSEGHQGSDMIYRTTTTTTRVSMQ